MTRMQPILFRSLIAATLLLAAAAAWTVHPFVHCPLALAVSNCGAASPGSAIPDDGGSGNAASQHSQNCQLCRMGDKSAPPAPAPIDGPALPVVERSPWIAAAELIPSAPLVPGLTPRAPPSQV